MEERNSGFNSNSQKPKQGKFSKGGPFLVLLVVLVIAALSFYGGVDYQKHHQVTATTTHSNNTSGQFGGGGSYGGSRGDRVIGQVTAVSSSSISVQNSRTGSTTTLAITGSTQITDNGQTVTANDIQVGDTVFVTENGSDTSQAATILVNPSFGGGSSQSGSNSNPSETTD